MTASMFNHLSFIPPPSFESIIVSNICLQVSFAIADGLLILSLPLLFALVCMSLVDVLSHLEALPSSKLHVHRRCLSSDAQSLQYSSNRSSKEYLVLHFERVGIIKLNGWWRLAKKMHDDNACVPSGTIFIQVPVYSALTCYCICHVLGDQLIHVL